MPHINHKNIKNEILEENFEVEETDTEFCADIYSDTQRFLEELVSYACLIADPKFPLTEEKKLQLIKEYLKVVHHHKRQIQKEIENVNQVRDMLKEKLKIRLYKKGIS